MTSSFGDQIIQCDTSSEVPIGGPCPDNSTGLASRGGPRTGRCAVKDCVEIHNYYAPQYDQSYADSAVKADCVSRGGTGIAL